MTDTAKKTAAKKTTEPVHEYGTVEVLPDDPQTLTVKATPEPSEDERLANLEKVVAGMIERDEAKQAELDALRAENEALKAAQAMAEPDHTYDLDEEYVAEGSGACLDCSCIMWLIHPLQPVPGADCFGCNHPFAQHKRHPAGARAKPAPDSE